MKLERQREGIAVAKAKDVYKGRKPSLTQERVGALRTRAAAGESKSNLAREFGGSRDTAYAYLRTGTARCLLPGVKPISGHVDAANTFP